MKSQTKPWLKTYSSDVPKDFQCPKEALFEILQKAAAPYPKKIALASMDTQVTFGELNDLSDRFAAGLAKLGVAKGDRVALYLPNIPQFVIAYYGVLKVGAVLTAISPLHREREVEYQLSDSGAETIVTLDAALPVVEAICQKTKLKHIIATSVEELTHKTPPPAQSKAPNIYRFNELLQTNANPPTPRINPAEDLAALQYTGGTTGTAKGAMLTHRNLVANAYAFSAWIKGASGDVFLAALPLFHIYGMTTSLNVPIALGCTIVLLPKFEPAKALQAIQQHRVTVFCGSPVMYQTLLANPDLAKYNLTSIRVCISGASPLPPQVQKQFMQVTGGLLAEGYGLTEASPVTHCSPVDPTLRTVRVGSIGLPILGTNAMIVDPETGTRTLPVGETGELAVRGPQVMKGYWRKPEETRSVLCRGWLLTGDLARMDADGYFYITDRKKDLIKYKDYSVYPRELEDVLYEHPAVRLCAVVGKQNAAVGEVPKAYVVLKEGVQASTEEIKAFVNGKVAAYKAIREVEFRQSLPLSSAGKVLRRMLSDC